MNKKFQAQYGYNIADKRYQSVDAGGSRGNGGVDPRFERSIYQSKNKVKVIRDILANQKHR